MSENITKVIDTKTITDEEQVPVSTRIPELSNILLVGDEQFYINAKKAEEASKVSESLLINCVGPKEVTQVVYSGERQKSVSIVPATGGTFLGPLFARSSITISEDNDILVDDNAVVVASDFASLYTKHVKDNNGVTVANAERAYYADTADRASSADYAGHASSAGYATEATRADSASIATKASKLQVTKTDDNNSDNYINFYLGSIQPSDDVPVGSIWIKTKS